jgi:predicted DNA-binding transcriptional regulator AlpA
MVSLGDGTDDSCLSLTGEKVTWTRNQAAIYVSTSLALLGVSVSSAYRWHTHWLAFKRLPCQFPRRMRLHSNKASAAWPQEDLRKLKTVIDANPVYYVDELAAAMTIELGRNITYTSVYRALTSTTYNLGYSRKVVDEKASQAVDQERKDFITTLHHYVKTPEMAIFVKWRFLSMKATKIGPLLEENTAGRKLVHQ